MAMSNKIKIPFIIVLALIILALSLYFIILNRPKDTNTQNYISISMMNDKGEVLPSRNIKINQNSIFTSQLRISNFIPDDRQYLLKIYDNDNFIEFTLNNKAAIGHYIDLRKGEEKIYNLEINNFRYSGKHDLVLFLIAQPKNNQFSAIEKSLGKVTTSRFNITIGQQENELSKLPDNIEVNKYYTDTFNSSFDFVVTDKAIIKSTDGIKINPNIISKNGKHKFFMYMSNNTGNSIKYKIICLKNWSISNMNGKNYFLATVPPHKKLEIPIDVDINDSDIGNDLIFFRIACPFESMDNSNLDILAQKNYPINIDNSTRMIIKNNK